MGICAYACVIVYRHVLYTESCVYICIYIYIHINAHMHIQVMLCDASWQQKAAAESRPWPR